MFALFWSLSPPPPSPTFFLSLFQKWKHFGSSPLKRTFPQAAKLGCVLLFQRPPSCATHVMTSPPTGIVLNRLSVQTLTNTVSQYTQVEGLVSTRNYLNAVFLSLCSPRCLSDRLSVYLGCRSLCLTPMPASWILSSSF